MSIADRMHSAFRAAGETLAKGRPVHIVTLKTRRHIQREIPRELQGWWARAASLMTGLPRVAYRIQQLERAGLLRHDAGVAPSAMLDPNPLTARGTLSS